MTLLSSNLSGGGHEEDWKREVIRTKFICAAFSREIEQVLMGARPIAGRTWNSYIGAVLADSGREDLYVQNLLDLTIEITNAIDPNNASITMLGELKKLGSTRSSWPGFISSRSRLNDIAKAKCVKLNLGRRIRMGNISSVTGKVNSFLMPSMLRDVIGADSISGVSLALDGARPLLGRTWNFYIEMITTPSEEEFLYAQRLLDLAVILMALLDPAGVSDATLREFQKHAASRESWPGLISTRGPTIKRAKNTCRLLRLGSNDGREKKQPERVGPTSRGESVSGVLDLVATMLLNKAVDYAKRIPRKSPYSPKYWDFHYVGKVPPRFVRSEFWVDFAKVILDMEYGPRELRESTRRTHFEQFRNNLRPVDELADWQLSESLLIENHNLAWAVYQNSRINEPGFVEDRLRFMRLGDRRAVLIARVKITTAKGQDDWEVEPIPCILACPTVREYARRIAERKSEKLNNIKGASVVYDQLKKDVLRAVWARLPMT